MPDIIENPLPNVWKCEACGYAMSVKSYPGRDTVCRECWQAAKKNTISNILEMIKHGPPPKEGV